MKYTIKSGKTILVQLNCPDDATAIRRAAGYNCMFGGGVDVYAEGGRAVATGIHPGNVEEKACSVCKGTGDDYCEPSGDCEACYGTGVAPSA